MAFKLVEKKCGVYGLADNDISISKTSISFGNNFKDTLGGNGFFEVYLDKDNNKVGFKPANSSVSGFKVQFDKTNSKRISITSSKVTKLIPLGRYEARVEEGFIVIDVKEIFEEKKA